MSRCLGIFALVVLTAFAAAPAFSQSAPDKSKKSPGEIAATDLAANQTRANCRGEAKALKLSYLQRRHFVKNCMNR
jgi:hypothetical protein